jgi:hypothetical protein
MIRPSQLPVLPCPHVDTRVPALRTGCLAYYRGVLNEMVPCRVLRVYRGEPGVAGRPICVDVVMTADRGVYRKGERLDGMGWRYVIPRGAVRMRKTGALLLPYRIVEGTP